MAIEKLENFGRLFGITRDTEKKEIKVDVGLVHYDLDLQCVCDAVEFLAAEEGYKSLSIKTFGITINAGESPVEVYRKIQQKYRWYFEDMPQDIAAAQEKFEATKKSKKASSSSESNGSEPGERE